VRGAHDLSREEGLGVVVQVKVSRQVPDELQWRFLRGLALPVQEQRQIAYARRLVLHELQDTVEGIRARLAAVDRYQDGGGGDIGAGPRMCVCEVEAREHAQSARTDLVREGADQDAVDAGRFVVRVDDDDRKIQQSLRHQLILEV